MLNFVLSEKGLGTVFPPYFVYHFSRKMLMLYPFKFHFLRTLTFNQAVFLQDKKSQDKNANILRTKRASKVI